MIKDNDLFNDFDSFMPYGFHSNEIKPDYVEEICTQIINDVKDNVAELNQSFPMSVVLWKCYCAYCQSVKHLEELTDDDKRHYRIVIRTVG